MPTSQDQSAPTTGGTPDLGSDRESAREMVELWLFGAGCVLALLGMLIALMSPPSAAMWSGFTVGFLILSLAFHLLLTIPGALVALRHPWGGGFRRLLGERFAHPRIAGCTEIWAGLLFSCSVGILAFAPIEQLYGTVVTFGVIMVAIAPFVALALFDRRR